MAKRKKGRAGTKKSSKKSTVKSSGSNKLRWDHPASLLATWFGLGKMSFAPGTWGSLGAFPIVFFIFAMLPAENIFLGLLVSTIIVFFAGLWASEVYENSTGKKDSREIVIDEVAGQLLAITFITYNAGKNIIAPHVIIPYVIIFLLFRYFDIWKPWPCKNIEKNFKGGMGVMLDDVVAGIYAVIMFYALAVLMLLVLASSGALSL